MIYRYFKVMPFGIAKEIPSGHPFLPFGIAKEIPSRHPFMPFGIAKENPKCRFLQF